MKIKRLQSKKNFTCVHTGWQHLLGIKEVKNWCVLKTYRRHHKYTASTIWDLFAAPYAYGIDARRALLNCITAPSYLHSLSTHWQFPSSRSARYGNFLQAARSSLPDTTLPPVQQCLKTNCPIFVHEGACC